MRPIPFPKPSLLIALLLFALSCTPGRIQTSPVKGAPPSDPRTGRQLYIRTGCFQCHGIDGDGNGMMAASLKEAPRAFRRAADFRGGTNVHELAFTIKYASQWHRVSNQKLEGMPDYSALSDPDLLALAAWVRYLQTNLGP